jgi:SHS2 domain-containing protein
MKYRYLDGIAVSDCAFEAFGKSEKELFENSARAVLEEMAQTKKVPLKRKKKAKATAESLEMLLYNFLAEIILLKDKENMVFGKIAATIKKKKKKSDSQRKKKAIERKKGTGARKIRWTATATLWGEKVSKLDETIIRRDVKAVTFHRFKIAKIKHGLKATVVLDI